MAVVTNTHEFENLCKYVFVERYYNSGYQGMLPAGSEITRKDIEVLEINDAGCCYTCRIATVIPEDRIYANYTYVKETRKLHESFYIQLSRQTYEEEDL